jgi:GWxTD domain-containing protein
MIDALAWTLAHFVWQGALLGAAAWAVLKALPERRPETRYAIACALLAGMAICPMVTLALVWPPGNAPGVPSLTFIVPASLLAEPERVTQAQASWTLWAVTLWVAGLMLMAVRAAGGWLWAWRRQYTDRRPLPQSLLDAGHQLALRMGIRRGIRRFAGARIDAPQVFGWFKPVVLVPLSALTSMPPQHLEAVLAHELAHIRRHDFLVNACQVLVETVLFYHPAVWWLSARVREEREACCDRVAAEQCGDAVLYGHALVALEESRERYALAASGFGLARRVRRLLAGGEGVRPSWLLAAVTAASLVLVATSASWLLAQSPAPPVPPPPVAAPAVSVPQAPPATTQLQVPAGEARARLSEDDFRLFQRDLAALLIGSYRRDFPSAQFDEKLTGLFDKYGRRLHQSDGGPVAQKDYLDLLLSQMGEEERKGTRFSPQHLSWVQIDVGYLITPEERATFLTLKDEAQRDEFIRQFWQRRPGQEKEHYRRLAYANERYGSLSSDRSRAYIVWGPPDEIESHPGDFEVWTWRDGRSLRFEGSDYHLVGRWPRD